MGLVYLKADTDATMGKTLTIYGVDIINTRLECVFITNIANGNYNDRFSKVFTNLYREIINKRFSILAKKIKFID